MSAPERCKICDGTGDVHDQTGEWRGECTACDVATIARLSCVCRLLGLETAVPADDATLMGCLFSVLGMIRRVIEQRAGKTENEIDRLETEVAKLTAERDVLLKCIEAANQNLAGHSRQIDVLTAELQEWDRLLRSSVPERFNGNASSVAAVQGYIFELQDQLEELQEVRKDAVIHRGGERPSDGWYWMRWHVDSPAMSPWTILNTFPGPVSDTTEWVGPLKTPEAPKP